MFVVYLYFSVTVAVYVLCVGNIEDVEYRMLNIS